MTERTGKLAILKPEQIRDVVRQIRRTAHPEQIILFGSYCYGRPRKTSDLDLMVIGPFEGSPYSREHQVQKLLTPDFPNRLGLAVHSRTSLEERLELGDWFVREALTRGQSAYRRCGAPNYLRWPRLYPEFGSRPPQGDPPLLPLTRQWINIGESSWYRARYSFSEDFRFGSYWGLVVENSHWCAMMHLKGYLFERRVVPRKGRDLVKIARQLKDERKTWDPLAERMAWVTAAAHEAEHHLREFSKRDAERAIRIGGRVREIVREQLGLKESSTEEAEAIVTAIRERRESRPRT